MKFIEPYNPKWPIAFEELRQFLFTQLAGGVPSLDIQHVGSTAIPGLIAKAILDIDIIIEKEVFLPLLDTRLQQLGYISKGEQGIPERFAYRQQSRFTPIGTAQRSWHAHHLYVCIAGTLALKNHLLFRDMLLQDAQLMLQYTELKKG